MPSAAARLPAPKEHSANQGRHSKPNEALRQNRSYGRRTAILQDQQHKRAFGSPVSLLVDDHFTKAKRVNGQVKSASSFRQPTAACMSPALNAGLTRSDRRRHEQLEATFGLSYPQADLPATNRHVFTCAQSGIIR